jgi:hypothetical protein
MKQKLNPRKEEKELVKTAPHLKPTPYSEPDK